MGKIYLNVGCGQKKIPGFINIDKEPGADLQVDVRQGLPFADNSVEAIFSEHFIEHLSVAEAMAFLRECRRVLVAGGVLRIATPDLDKFIAHYLSDWRDQAWIRDFGYEWLSTRAEMLNVAMRYWGHQWLYNEEELTRLAEYAGLSFKGRYCAGHSDIPKLSGLEYRKDSLIVEYIKENRVVRNSEPLVSILIPAYRPEYLEPCIESALKQTYQRIEVIVADDSHDSQIERIVIKYAKYVNRVSYYRNPYNLGAFQNYLRLLELAKGEYIKFLNDDDVLHPRCVEKMASILLAHPHVTLVTSHRQRIGPDGSFLPDIPATERPIPEDGIINGVSAVNTMLRLKLNFIGEPTTCMFRREDVAGVKPHIFSLGGVPIEWNVDVVMWINLLSKGDLSYLVETLSFFRQHPYQQQLSPEAPIKGAKAWEQILENSRRLGFLSPFASQELRWMPLSLVASEQAKASHEVCHPKCGFSKSVPETLEPYKQVRASIIIPVCNNWQYTRRCLLSLEAAGYRDKAEVIVVDNASTDETPSRLKEEFPWVKVLRNEQNLGFASACNLGAAAATGTYLVFLNNDTEVERGWLEALIGTCEAEPGVGIVGSKLLYPDGRIQHAGVRIKYADPYPIQPEHICYGEPDVGGERSEVDAVTGASMLVPRTVFYELSGFDEAYKNGYEDVDFCLRARAKGYRILYEPASRAIHHESKTPGRFARVRENIGILHRRWLPYVIQRYRHTHFPEGLPEGAHPPASIIIVTYNSLATIAPCLESVLAATTPADEIIVIDNSSRDETAYYIESLKDGLSLERLKLHREPQNLGYARAAAKGARLAGKDFLVFLNPDTVVYPGWLKGLLEALAQHESVAAAGPVSNYAAGLQNVTRFLPGNGRRSMPQPSQLAEELFRQYQGRVVRTGLLSGFCLAVKRQAYEKVGGFDEDLFLGNDDLDFSWRLAKAGYEQVVVPSVFVFHKGQESFGTESGVKTKYLVQQSTNQLYEKLYDSYTGSPPDGKSLWGIEWFAPQKDTISIIMPVYRGSSVTRRALEALLQRTSRPLEIIIIDNGSDPETRRVVTDFAESFKDRVQVIRNEENLGYPAAVNQGLAAASGQYLVVMNNDVVVTPYWASRMLAAFAVDPAIGIVGPRTNFAAGIQAIEGCVYDEDSLGAWADRWYLKNAGSLRQVTRLIGFLWMMKREVVEKIGGFDPLFGTGNFEDDDYCLRAQLAGYKLVLANDVFVHHYGSHSFKRQPEAYGKLLETNRMLFAAKWGIDFAGNGYRPEQVLARGLEGVDPGDLHVPLQLEAVFSPDVPPLDVGYSAPAGILCVPDPSDRDRTWLELVRSYALSFKPGDGLALIIRVEPSSKEWMVRVVSSVQEMARREGIDLERNDIVIEARKIPSSQRGRVYRAATFFVPLPEVRKEALTREARRCGLSVVELQELTSRCWCPPSLKRA